MSITKKNKTAAGKKAVVRTKKSNTNSNSKVSSPRNRQRANINKDDFMKQNIIALFLLVLGMFFLLSMKTNALGPVGQGLRAMLMGQFASIAVMISLTMILVGAARLMYSSKFSLHIISPLMVLLILFGSMLFYGALKINSIVDATINISSLKLVFVESVVGKSVGIWPYILSVFIGRFVGKLGLLLISVTLFLFVGIYYFRLSFSKLGDASIAIANEGKRAAKGIKRRTLDYITLEDTKTNVKQKELFQPEKLDDTLIDKKFGFIERYKAEIAEFTEYSSEENMVSNDMDRISKDFVYDSHNNVDQEQYNEEVIDDEIINRELFQQNIEQIANQVVQGEFEEIPQSCEGSLNMEIMSLSGDDPLDQNVYYGETREYVGLSDLVEKTIENDEITQDSQIVDQRQVYIHDKLEKENLENLGESDSTGRITPMEREYQLPSTSLLKNYKIPIKESDKQIKNSQKLESTLEIFGVEAKVVNVAVGPSITRFELQPKMGVKVSKILNLSDDLALALAAVAPIRIEAPIPGTSLIGIELPNARTEVVSFRSVLESPEFINSEGKLPITLGRDVTGKPVIEDIAKMPHVLVAGATGSGKSVCINTLICSILYKSKPEDVKMIMIDPKMVELSVYNNIPHLLIPVVTDMKKAPYALSWAVNETNKRYHLFTENRVRDLDGYNSIKGIQKLPRIVIVVDELADLMMVSPNEVEDAIIRLAQKARACGMHLVIATQRPSVDVITGLIKANIPTRIAFAVSSQIDSRTIIDQVGAEKLIGKGDMLYSHQSTPKPLRIQGPFVSDSEVNQVVDYILSQKHNNNGEKVDIIEETMKIVAEVQKEDELDPLLEQIADFAINNKQISTSLVQRRFRIGYNRASRIIDQLEEMGVVSESDGAKPRKVLISTMEETPFRR